MTEESMVGQVVWSDVGLQFGKMSEEHSVPDIQKERTSSASLRSSSASSKKTLPLFLYLKEDDGQGQGASWVTERTDALFPSLGDFIMHSFGEFPNEENASVLSQILEERPQEKYSLSSKACIGILNRADKKGKPLPPILKEALENQI